MQGLYSHKYLFEQNAVDYFSQLRFASTRDSRPPNERQFGQNGTIVLQGILDVSVKGGKFVLDHSIRLPLIMDRKMLRKR